MGNDSSHEETEPSSLDTSENMVELLLDQWGSMGVLNRQESFSHLNRTDAEELFLRLTTHDQAELLRDMPSLEKRSWVRLLAPDDVADVIQDLGSHYREECLSLLDPQTRREVTALLAYAEDNAGGLMSSRFVRLRPDMTVDEAISYLRIQSKTHVETIYYAYVLENDQTLMGVVSFRELFQAAPSKLVREIMKTDLIEIPVNLDQEKIAKIFSQHDLMAIPVVDEWRHMKGIVTFDDVQSVVQEEATEDIQKIGGVEALDAPYMKVAFFEMIRKRAGWLTILFFSEMFTATAMTFFKDEISKAVVLSLFIPLIISSGGNSGSQATTLIIRAMALGEIRLRDWWRVLGRELLSGATLGFLLGCVAFLRIFFWPNNEGLYGPHYPLLALTVATSVLGVVLWGTISGSMLPFVLRRVGFDPASSSAPFVATLVDVTGLVIYFSIASAVLSGSLL
ncbi:MAG: magnesium transporter [Bdellovibrio sp.]